MKTRQQAAPEPTRTIVVTLSELEVLRQGAEDHLHNVYDEVGGSWDEASKEGQEAIAWAEHLLNKLTDRPPSIYEITAEVPNGDWQSYRRSYPDFQEAAKAGLEFAQARGGRLIRIEFIKEGA